MVLSRKEQVVIGLVGIAILLAATLAIGSFDLGSGAPENSAVTDSSGENPSQPVTNDRTAKTATPADDETTPATPSTNPSDPPPVEDRTLEECRVIDEPGRYELVADLHPNSLDRCVVVTASDVVLDGQGYTVEGNGTAGIAVGGETRLTNVTIENVSVAGWEFGVHYNWTAESRIENVTATANGIDGIRLEATERTLVTRTSATRNRFGGISLSRSPENRLRSNEVRGNTDGIAVTDNSTGTVVRETTAIANSNQGIFVWSSGNVTVERSTVVLSPRGISVMGSPGTTLVHNELSQNLAGISVQGSNGITIGNNTATNNRYGFRLRFVDRGTLSDNVVRSSEFHGIDLFSSTRVTVENTTVTASGYYGINLRRSTRNVLLDNVINGSDGSGIVLAFDSDNNRVLKNQLNRNRRGIVVFSSDGNELSNNSVNSHQST